MLVRRPTDYDDIAWILRKKQLQWASHQQKVYGPSFKPFHMLRSKDKSRQLLVEKVLGSLGLGNCLQVSGREP
jgi:hypothetical protein